MNPTTTRVRAFIYVLASGCCFAMVGCSNPARDRMIGQWEANFEMSDEDLEKVTPKDNPIASSLGKILMKSLRANIQWEFAADNTAVASGTFLGNTITRNGTWQFLSAENNTTTVRVQFEDDEPREVNFVFSDADTLEATPPPNGKWQLTRVLKFKRVVTTP